MGCRTRAAKTTLLRVVAVDGVLVPDRAGRLPGRGASVHFDLQCVALAERRRAFPRALRLAGPLDVSPVADFVQAVLRTKQTEHTEHSEQTKHAEGQQDS